MLRFLSKRKICCETTDSISFFDLVTLTVPIRSSINKRWIPSGFLLCASSKWWNFKPAIFQAIIWLNSILSTRFCNDEKFIFTRFWLLRVSIAQMSENVQCDYIAWLLKTKNVSLHCDWTGVIVLSIHFSSAHQDTQHSMMNLIYFDNYLTVGVLQPLFHFHWNSIAMFFLSQSLLYLKR